MGNHHQLLHDVEQCVDAIINRVGKTIVIGMPLGLGKPVELVNALYDRAKTDASIQLKILTALSLEIPQGSSPLEKAFLEPFVKRVYGDCPQLHYMRDLRKQALPDNVTVSEFFFKPGSFMGNPVAQQGYISSNYTHAARDVFEQGCNVAAQAVCLQEQDGVSKVSLSCNPDTGPELVEMLRAAEAAGERKVCVVGQVNQNLPYMGNDAEVDPDTFDLILDDEHYYKSLFSTPKLSVATADYLIGLNASALIKDGGTLQIGIGALGDAIVHAAKLRHSHNDSYKQVLDDAGILAQQSELVAAIGGTEPFEKGLYGATEMFVDGFLHLYEAGILKRKVYDFWALQQLVNEGRCDPNALSADVFDALESLGVRVIRTKDFDVLQHHGFFNDETVYDNGYIIAPDGTRVIANMADPETRRVLGEQCLGQQLRNGIVLHGGFFLGPNDFYQGLRDLSDEQRKEICMTGVYKVNQLDHNPRLYKLQRQHARFINTGIMATLSGAVVSDGVDDGRVVSGVGGQFNFVDMAHHLQTGRSLLMVRSYREKDGIPSSNIVWNYAHCTIPRHLRDIVITEYGIANLRSKTDSEVIKALLNVADSRFQTELLDQAKAAGKVEADYQIPAAHQNNRPQRLEEILAKHKQAGLFPPFPLGTDLTEEEQTLGKALKGLQARANSEGKLALMWKASRVKTIPAAAQPWLHRMQLDNPSNMQERVTQKLLVLELQKIGAI